MSSEAEFERLYREFVQNNGGIPTLVGTQYNTPASYYNDSSSINLTPSELASLQAKQQQFNRQSALNTISSEISTNNFTNPYDQRSQLGVNNINNIESQSGYSDTIAIRNSLDSLSDTDRKNLVDGVFNQTGVNLDRLAGLPVLTTTGLSMFNSLQSHTNDQSTDIPGKIQEIDQLIGINSSFGEMPNDPCMPFNDLMGILSGSFDGVLDFIEGGISSILNTLITPAIENALNLVGGALAVAAGAISSAIGSIVDTIMDIPLIKDLANTISSVIGGISDIVSQIAQEISGLTSLAAEAASKLAALGLAGVFNDPCKLAVLQNTGSPALLDAASKLNMPFDTGQPTFNIPVETDDRSNPLDVSRAVESAVRNAEASAGVPQSPTSVIGSLYQPFSAYLSGLVTISDGIFSDAYELVQGDASNGAVVNRISSTSEDNPAMTDLSSITSTLRGTVGDISNNIGSILSGSPINTNSWSDDITGGAISNTEDFAIGGIVGDAGSSLIGNVSNIIRSSPEQSSQTRIVRETTLEGTSLNVVGPSKQIASARQLWNKRYKSDFGNIVKISSAIMKETKNYIDNAKFREDSIRRETQLAYEEAQNIKRDVLDFQKTESKKFEYTSRTQDRDSNIENSILQEYNTSIINRSDVMIGKSNSAINNLESKWSSLKSQAIL